MLEKIDYDFLHEESLKQYMKTLIEISNENFAPIQCDQGSSENYKRMNACDYAKDLIRNELREMEAKKKEIYKELD